MIPWLAQTDEYAPVYWLPPNRPGPWTAKLNRGDAIELPAGLDQVELLVHEWALRTPVGTQSVRSVQMHGLRTLSMASNLSVRVIPADWVLPVTALSGFTLLEFADRLTLLYREEPASSVFIDDPDQVAAHLEIVRQLRQIALNPSRSRELMERIKDEPAPEVVPIDLFPG